MILGKVWGTTECLLSTPFLEIHRLTIVPHAHCSLHLHKSRCNAFFVLSGKLWIDVHQDAYKLVDRTLLLPGQTTSVPNGLRHRFCTEDQAVECLELYYPPPLEPGDIIREDIGGRD